MRAAVWYAKNDVRVENVPEPPAPGKGEVKIKVFQTGICGSDLHEYDAGPIFIPTEELHPLTGRKAPLILGHEFSGEVVEVGQGVTNVRVGDRVAPDAAQHCGVCYMCKVNRYSLCEKLAFTGLMTDGSFAEYVNVPAYTCYKLLPEISNEAGALVEPLAVGIHAIRQGKLLQGDTVAVVGTGTIGLVTIQAARAAGASKVFAIELSKDRKEKAKGLGAIVLDPTETDVAAEIQDQTEGQGVDVAVECIGKAATVNTGIQCAKRGGKIVVVGIFEKPGEINYNDLVFQEKEIIGSLAYYGEFDSAIALLADGRIKAEPLITGKIKLDDIVENGFEELLKNRESNIKILVES
jgi:(R,R)-butanediol dehydrogenase / meso-butanediol dehydrogenase / diacetyl reductase